MSDHDTIEKIVAEMRVSVGVLAMMSNTRVAVPRATLTNWADRIESLRQVPEGYVLVPVKFTPQMRDAYNNACKHDQGAHVPTAWLVSAGYAAMIAAAPKANPAPPTRGREELANVSGLREAMLVVADRIEHRADLLPPSVPTDRHMFRSNAAEIRILASTIKPEPTPAQAGAELPEECTHHNTSAGYDCTICQDCGAFRTDSGDSWGTAKCQWFDSRSEASFYRDHGRLPGSSKRVHRG